MLKLIYTEMGLHLEHVPVPLSEWLQQRIRFALQVGEPIWVETSHGSLLLPRSATADPRLATLPWEVCDSDWVEVSLWGTWLTSDPDGDEGILAVVLEPHLEQDLIQIWLATRVPSFLPLWD